MTNQVLSQVMAALAPLTKSSIEETLKLLNDGNTVPFIARYRKEVTGNLDEVQIKAIEDSYRFYSKLDERRETIQKAITDQGKMTDDLASKIQTAKTLQELEDLYRPYKQKKQTKATLAREKGLLPLAERMLRQAEDLIIDKEVRDYIDEEKDLPTPDAVLEGVHEILAEMISDEPDYRRWIRQFTIRTGILTSQVKKDAPDEQGVYEMYYDFSQPVAKMANHQILALNRAERDKVVTVSIKVDMSALERYFKGRLIHDSDSPAVPYIEAAYRDSYKRFIGPAIEREVRGELTERAENEAIQLFGHNLSQLLLQSPLSGETVLGLDPAYRTGCKLAVIDPTGKVLGKGVIYPHKPAPAHKREAAKGELLDMIQTYGVTCVAIGNGTASRESEQFVADLIRENDLNLSYVIVNEAGASVYSASEIAREEFPDYHVEERSAVSIARRLQDPLAELVKIDPKAVGVGQYQHDVSQKALRESLDFVVLQAVNSVGVDLNTASVSLLEHVSGLNKGIAKNIVAYREEEGRFEDRQQLKQVKRLGNKAFEQAAGFLRISGGKQALDKTAIHPESYAIAKDLLAELGLGAEAIATPEMTEAIQQLDVPAFLANHEIGELTLKDILEQLQKGCRDPREDAPKPILRQDVLSIDDLTPGMALKGTVRNIVDFGIFVDIGVKQDGLVHISKMSKSYIKHPSSLFSIGDIVEVYVEKVEHDKKRISLTMLK